MGAETIVLIDWATAQTHRRLVERGARLDSMPLAGG
jgi:hypothetical protein